MTNPPTLVKKALVIGVDRHANKRLNLRFAMADAIAVTEALAFHWTPPGAIPLPNWTVDSWIEQDRRRIESAPLRKAIRDFLTQKVAPDTTVDLLLYFSGHAVYLDRYKDTYLQAWDSDEYPASFTDLFHWATASTARSITLVLDCCYSGRAFTRENRDPLILNEHALLPDKVSILTASASNRTAKEMAGHGVFTGHVLIGLSGGAADLIGDVTPAGLFAHVKRAMAGTPQQPVFKSFSIHQPVLRRAEPQVHLEQLQKLAVYFDGQDWVELTPFHEGLPPGSEGWHEGDDEGSLDRLGDNYKRFGGSAKQIELDYLKILREAHLLRSDDGRDFYMLCTRPPKPGSGESNTVSLTPLGRYYRDLAVAGTLGHTDDLLADKEVEA